MTASETKDMRDRPLIGIVGACSAGKTTLIQKLTGAGLFVRHIAQEHSFVPDMWQRLTQPDVLIFLDVSYGVSQQRRRLDWTETDFLEQQDRLKHARAHASLVVNTDSLTSDQVFFRVLDYLRDQSII